MQNLQLKQLLLLNPVMATMDMDIIMARDLLKQLLSLDMVITVTMDTMVMVMDRDIMDMDTIMAKGLLRLMLSLDMVTMVMVMDMDMATMAVDMVMDIMDTMDKHQGLS